MSSHHLKARGRLRARNKNWSPKWTKWPQMQCFFPIRLMQCFFPFRNSKNEALLKFSMDQKRSMNTFYLFFVDVKMHQWYQWPTLKVDSLRRECGTNANYIKLTFILFLFKLCLFLPLWHLTEASIPWWQKTYFDWLYGHW